MTHPGLIPLTSDLSTGQGVCCHGYELAGAAGGAGGAGGAECGVPAAGPADAAGGPSSGDTVPAATLHRSVPAPLPLT